MHNAAVLNGVLTLNAPYNQNGIIECPGTGDISNDFSAIMNEPIKYTGRTKAKILIGLSKQQIHPCIRKANNCFGTIIRR